MCTIVLGICINDSALPWTVAANRDEQLSRPSAPPRIIEDAGHRILMPQDLVYGGTWIGINDRGLLVALTNRDSRGEQRGMRSRGLLVRDALRCMTAHEAATLAADTAARYKHFHLVAADRSDVQLVVHGHSPTIRERLSRGWHIITEQSFGAGDDLRGTRIRQHIVAHPHTTRGYPDPPPPICPLGEPVASFGIASLVGLLSTHVPGDPFDSACVHTTHRGHRYGTRSFFAAEFDPWDFGETMHWWSREGQTCDIDPTTLGGGTTFPPFAHPSKTEARS